MAFKLSDWIRFGRTKPPAVELGATGTVFFAGRLSEEEYLVDLRGEKGIKVYDRMRRSDGQVKAALLACELPLRSAHWDIEAASDNKQDQVIADAVRDNLFNNMTITFDDFLRHILLMLPFGFSVFEKVWELREGVWCWRKFAPRLPKTIAEWKFDDEGGLAGVKQRTWKGNLYQDIDIPVDKLLVFTNSREGSNYEGISLLRAAYKHWYYKDQLYRIDGIAAERHGVGLAVFHYPSATPKEDKDAVSAIGERLHAHERAYIALPEEIKFDLQGVAGQLHDIKGSIEHHDIMIVRSILAQFINLGASDVGSFALSQDQSGFFLMALRAIGKNICDTFNRHAIQQLVDYNWEVVKYPQLTVSGLEFYDIAKYSVAISALVNSGLIMPDRNIEAELRRQLRLPAIRAPEQAVGGREIRLAEWRPWRHPRGMEQHLALNDIKQKFDSAEEEFVKACKKVQDKQISVLVKQVADAIEAGDIDKVTTIGVPYVEKLADAVEEVLIDLYQFGRQQVMQEAGRQRGKVTAQEPILEGGKLAAGAFIKTRARATAAVLGSKLRSSMAWEALGQIRQGVVDRAALTSVLTSLSDRELQATAKFSVTESFDLGREQQAKEMSDEIDRVIYSAILDDNTCGECMEVDGKEYKFPSAEWDEVTPPYKKCSGHERCRCVGVYVFKGEHPALPIAPPKPPVAPLVPPRAEAPIETFGTISNTTKARVNEVYSQLPPKSQEGIKKIELYKERGRTDTFDHGEFTVGADFNPQNGAVRIFDVNKNSMTDIQWTLGHEAGHAAELSVSPKSMDAFVNAVEREGTITNYARNWYASNIDRGIEENFAEWHKAFVMQVEGNMDVLRASYPDSYKVFNRIWIDELGGKA
jgi:hypothetical protein